MQGESVVATSATERRLAAIMVADVAGFSRLMERDESLTFARLRQLREEVTHRKVGEQGGRLVKTTGDGFLAEFASAVYAARCAIEVQRGMIVREAGRSVDTRIRLRIGINVGDIIVDSDDVAGDESISPRAWNHSPPRTASASPPPFRKQLRRSRCNARRSGRSRSSRTSRGRSAPSRSRLQAAGPAHPPGVRSGDAGACRIPSIAVLPFVQPESRRGERINFADGLAEEL
jgi:adenylate cyclase